MAATVAHATPIPPPPSPGSASSVASEFAARLAAQAHAHHHQQQQHLRQAPAPTAASVATTITATTAQPPSPTTTSHSHTYAPSHPRAQPQPQPPCSPLRIPGKLGFSDFVVVRTLGTGTFARVCLVRPSPTFPQTLVPPTSQQPVLPVSASSTSNLPRSSNSSNSSTPNSNSASTHVFALKILRKTDVIRLKQLDHVRHERSILADVAGHPFITNMVATFSDKHSLYMVLDYVPGGELFTYLRKLRRFDEATARFYISEIVLVLEFLHEHQAGVAYRDLKPENLLLDAEGHVKLVDFGFAKRLGRGNHEGGKGTETYTLCGTPEYLAPEVIHNKGHTTAVDWWALGILLYEFLTGYPPFWHQNPIEIYKQIVEKPVLFPSEPAISTNAKDLIRAFCTVDRSRRLGNISGGAARVKAHPFLKDVDWDAIYHRRINGPIIPPVRFPGDAQCFDLYPEDDGRRDPYPDDMARQYDRFFEDF